MRLAAQAGMTLLGLERRFQVSREAAKKSLYGRPLMTSSGSPDPRPPSPRGPIVRPPLCPPSGRPHRGGRANSAGEERGHGRVVGGVVIPPAGGEAQEPLDGGQEAVVVGVLAVDGPGGNEGGNGLQENIAALGPVVEAHGVQAFVPREEEDRVLEEGVV